MQGQSRLLDTLDYLLEVPQVIFPTGAVNDNIVKVRTGKVIKTIQQVIDHSLERCWGTLKPKWRAPELKETKGGCEGSLLSISWGYWDLPVSLCEVNSGDEWSSPYLINEFIQTGHGIWVHLGEAIESTVINAKT